MECTLPYHNSGILKRACSSTSARHHLSMTLTSLSSTRGTGGLAAASAAAADDDDDDE